MFDCVFTDGSYATDGTEQRSVGAVLLLRADSEEPLLVLCERMILWCRQWWADFPRIEPKWKRLVEPIFADPRIVADRSRLARQFMPLAALFDHLRTTPGLALLVTDEPRVLGRSETPNDHVFFVRSLLDLVTPWSRPSVAYGTHDRDGMIPTCRDEVLAGMRRAVPIWRAFACDTSRSGKEKEARANQEEATPTLLAQRALAAVVASALSGAAFPEALMDPEIRPLLADVRRVSGFILDDPRVRDPAAIHDLLRGYRGPEWLPKDPRGRKRLRKAIAIWTARWRSSWEPPLDLVRFDESDARLTPIMLIPDFIAGFYGFFAYSIRWFGTGKGPRSNMSDQFELVEELLGVRRLNLASSLGDRIGVPTTLARR